MKVSALVAVYSETTLLVETIRRLKLSLGDDLREIILIVSPRSTKECLDLCQTLSESDPVVRSIIQSEKRGIGWAYREAIPHITGTHGLILSSDLETDPDDAGKFVRAAEESGADIVNANRWSADGGFSGYSPSKLILNYGYNVIFRMLYGIRIHDITFGYKLVRAEVLRQMQWEYGQHEFCAELLLKPIRAGYTAVEVSTKWIKRPEGESKNTFFRNFKFVSAAWRIRFAQPQSFQVPKTSPGRMG
jgi:dolichol-phosphate mannosyltransferase